jgi:hypothetical protein
LPASSQKLLLKAALVEDDRALTAWKHWKTWFAEAVSRELLGSQLTNLLMR